MSRKVTLESGEERRTCQVAGCPEPAIVRCSGGFLYCAKHKRTHGPEPPKDAHHFERYPFPIKRRKPRGA
jgi:hypothetical protein